MSRKILIPIILAGLGLTFCDTGIEIDLTCLVKHTAWSFRARSQILGEKEWSKVNLTWSWTVKRPDGDSVIVERSPGGEGDYTFLGSTGVDSAMTYTDNDTVINSGGWFTYRLSLANGNKVDPFKETNVSIPNHVDIWRPGTDSLSIPNDTLEIRWHLSQAEGDYTVEIFKACPTEPESLINLTDPIFSQTTTDTVIMVEVPDSLFPTLNFYTIKVTNSKLVEYVTDTSVGFRAFFRLP